MSEQKNPLPLPVAEDMARGLIETISPFCERAEIAGSIRRKKPSVSDIEIVAIPKWEEIEKTGGLFVEQESTNMLHRWALNVKTFNDPRGSEIKLQWIKPGVLEFVPWSVKADGKYWRGSLNDDRVRLDLFLCKPDNWGVIFLMRTGSATFSEGIMTRALQRNTRVTGGYMTNFGKPIAMREEKDVFEFLALRYVRPEDRREENDVYKAAKERRQEDR